MTGIPGQLKWDYLEKRRQDNKLYKGLSLPTDDLIPLTLNAPVATKVVWFSRLLKCLRSLFGKPIGAVCSWFTLFASMLNSSVMLGIYLQQTTFSEVFSWRLKG